MVLQYKIKKLKKLNKKKNGQFVLSWDNIDFLWKTLFFSEQFTGKLTARYKEFPYTLCALHSMDFFLTRLGR